MSKNRDVIALTVFLTAWVAIAFIADSIVKSHPIGWWHEVFAGGIAPSVACVMAASVWRNFRP